MNNQPICWIQPENLLNLVQAYGYPLLFVFIVILCLNYQHENILAIVVYNFHSAENVSHVGNRNKDLIKMCVWGEETIETGGQRKNALRITFP